MLRRELHGGVAELARAVGLGLGQLCILVLGRAALCCHDLHNGRRHYFVASRRWLRLRARTHDWLSALGRVRQWLAEREWLAERGVSHSFWQQNEGSDRKGAAQWGALRELRACRCTGTQWAVHHHRSPGHQATHGAQELRARSLSPSFWRKEVVGAKLRAVRSA